MGCACEAALTSLISLPSYTPSRCRPTPFFRSIMRAISPDMLCFGVCAVWFRNMHASCRNPPRSYACMVAVSI